MTGPTASPDHKPAWLATSNRTVLVVPRRDGWNLALQTQELVGSSFQVRCNNIIASSPVSIHTRWAITVIDDDTAVLFCATPDGTLKVSRAAPCSQTWPPLADMANGRRMVHHYSQLVATSRGGESADAFFIDGARTLHTAFWGPQGKGDQPIGKRDTELLPTTALAACSPASDTIVVAGVGYDLKLQLACWTTIGDLYWTSPYPVGHDDDLLSAHTDLAIAWNKWTRQVEVLAISNNLDPCLYELTDAMQRMWLPTSGTRTSFEYAASPQAGQIPPASPNPFGDVVLGFTSSGTRLIGCIFNFTSTMVRSPGVLNTATPGLTRTTYFTSPASASPPARPHWIFF